MPRGILKARGTIRNAPERQNGEISRENGESQNGEISRENGENYSFLTGTPLLACSFIQDRVYVSREAEFFIYSSAVKDLEYASLSYSIFSFRDDISTPLSVASEPATCTTHIDFVVFWSRFIWPDPFLCS